MKTIALTILMIICCIVAEEQCMTLPSQTLKQFFGGCRTTTDSRDLKCVTAISRYCEAVRFKYFGSVPLLGLSRATETNKIEVSCVRSTYSGWGTVTELNNYNHQCKTIGDLQTSHCLDALHRYCNNKAKNQGGLSTGKNGPGQILITCFKSALNQYVTITDLQKQNGTCSISNSASSACFNAACKWCETQGHSGGITQGDFAHFVQVSCYDDIFHEMVTVQ